jgi:alpha-L-fucosidase 2
MAEIIEHPFHLRYDTPAERWCEALPLGNGRLGAMVYGHACVEKIQLNDDSLWYGAFHDRNNPSLKEKLPEIRRLVLAGDIYRAEELIMQHMVGTPCNMRHYTNLGELDIALHQHLPFAFGWMPSSVDASAYMSDLDLMTGVLTINHTQGEIRYRREMFISKPAQVMCIHLVSDMPEAIGLDMMMNRCMVSDASTEDDRRPGHRVNTGGWPGTNADSIRAVDGNTILMRGHAAEVAFAAAVRIVCDGAIHDAASQLLVRGASEVLLYVATATSNRVEDPVADVMRRLDAAEAKGYERLRQDHIADFSALMNRCRLDLGAAPERTTDKRITTFRAGADDPTLAALYFQFGRYLIVSGGREESAALNLQGIWNADFTPAWDSKYTININLQMNYWPVEVCNLSSLHAPLMDLLAKMREKGCETARIMYGMRGMVCHHNTDFYGDCAPQDWYMAATPWVTGGAWLGLHVWEHFLYTRNMDFLRTMYPILRDMALFYTDYLIELEGKLVTCPSVSPENRYILPDGCDTPICVGPAMDSQILRAFFFACMEIQRLLCIDTEMSETFAGIAARLPEDRVGSKGQLLEWDQEYPELTPDMGHVSHLFACYPGSGINWLNTPDLMCAVRKSLEMRIASGAGRAGWPLAWYINLYARLLDGDKTDRCIRKMLSDSTVRNLLNVGSVFQIDGNLGATAGIAECLLQSHIALHFLPALPTSWRNGSVTGLMARGAREVDIRWTEGRLTEATVRPLFAGMIEVVGEICKVICRGVTVPVEKTKIGFSFDGEAGQSYMLQPVR